MRRLRLLLFPLVLAGCAPWDQNTFQPSPEPEPLPPGRPDPAPRTDPRDPLVIIDYAAGEPLYRDPLRFALREAEARSRGIQYDVVAVVASFESAIVGQEYSQEVMRAMLADRISADRVQLGLRIDPSLTAPRVFVYVR